VGIGSSVKYQTHTIAQSGKVVVEATVGIRSKNDLQEVARSNGTTLTMVDCRPLDREGMVMLLEIEGTPDGVEKTLSAIRKMPGMRQVYEEEGVPGKLRFLATLDKPGVCRASTGSVVICIDCPFNSTEVPSKWNFALQRMDSLGDLMRRLSEEGVEARAEALSPIGSTSPFTDTDRKVISTAVQGGYFDFPRRIGLRGVSEITKIPISEVRRVLEG
jgi:hypothetical protein